MLWGLGSAFNSYLFKWIIKYCPDAAILFSREVNKWSFKVFHDFPYIQWLLSWIYDRRANLWLFKNFMTPGRPVNSHGMAAVLLFLLHKLSWTDSLLTDKPYMFHSFLIVSVLLIAYIFYFLIWITQNDVVKEKKLNSILLISEIQSFSISQDKKLLNGPRWILSFWLIKCNQLRLHGR